MYRYAVEQIDGLVQERRNSIADAMELRLSCTNPSNCYISLWHQQSYSTQYIASSVQCCETADTNWHQQWNRKVISLMKFSPQAALKVVIFTMSNAASDDEVIKVMMSFSFQWMMCANWHQWKWCDTTKAIHSMQQDVLLNELAHLKYHDQILCTKSLNLKPYRFLVHRAFSKTSQWPIFQQNC